MHGAVILHADVAAQHGAGLLVDQDRLADRLKRFTGAQADVHASEQPPVGPLPLVILGTQQNNDAIAAILRAEGPDVLKAVDELGEEGYLLRVTRWRDRPVLLATGRTPSGVHHAISELVSWRLRLTSGGASVAGDLHVCSLPPVGHQPTVSPFPAGSATVLVAGRPVLRTTDVSGCGAMAVVGEPTVLIN